MSLPAHVAHEDGVSAGSGTQNDATNIEKASANHIDRVLSLDKVPSHQKSVDEKNVPQIEAVDYSGAYTKTDPREIALVKKLDRWIMVSPLEVK